MVEIQKNYPLTSKPILCDHCGNRSRMLRICEGKYTQVFGSEFDVQQGYIEDLERRWQVLLCSSCEGVIVLQNSGWSTEEYIVHVDEQGEEFWERPFRQKILYPSQRKQLSHLPPSVAKAYEIAIKVLPIEPISFAVFAGRTLEFVCKDKEAKGKNLKDQLDDLAKRGEIPEVLADMAHSIRFFRNYGVHANEIEAIYREDADDLRQLCETVLEYVYEFRPMIERVHKRLSELKQPSNPEKHPNNANKADA